MSISPILLSILIGLAATLVIVMADARSALSPFVTYTPTTYPFAYTIAANESTSQPVDGTVDQGAAYAYNAAVWRDRDTNVLTFVDLQFHILRQLRGRQVTTIAGVSDSYGFRNGARLQALFNEPCAVVRFNNMYIIADRANNCLRNISALTGFSDVGTFSGICSSAFNSNSFSRPTSLDVSSSYVYVADQLNDVLRRVDASGAMTTLAGYEDWKPTHVAVLDDTLAFVINSLQELYRVNLATGVITNTNFNDGTANLIQPTIDKASRTLFFVSQNQVSLAQSVVGYDIDSGAFTTYLTYSSGYTDGANPAFRDVNAIHAISSYEIIVVQKLSIRGLFVRPRQETHSPSLTMTKVIKTATQNQTADPIRTMTQAVSASITPNEPLLVLITFLADRFPMTNATALEIIRGLMLLDLNDCLANVTVARNVSTLVLSANELTVSANASMVWNMPTAAINIIRFCSYTRVRNYLMAEWGGSICSIDPTSTSITSKFCGVAGPTIRTCDTKCKVATIVSSIAFATFVGAAIILALMASGKGFLVSALLLLPTSF